MVYSIETRLFLSRGYSSLELIELEKGYDRHSKSDFILILLKSRVQRNGYDIVDHPWPHIYSWACAQGSSGVALLPCFQFGVFTHLHSYSLVYIFPRE